MNVNIVFPGYKAWLLKFSRQCNVKSFFHISFNYLRSYRHGQFKKIICLML